MCLFRPYFKFQLAFWLPFSCAFIFVTLKRYGICWWSRQPWNILWWWPWSYDHINSKKYYYMFLPFSFPKCSWLVRLLIYFIIRCLWDNTKSYQIVFFYKKKVIFYVFILWISPKTRFIYCFKNRINGLMKYLHRRNAIDMI